MLCIHMTTAINHWLQHDANIYIWHETTEDSDWLQRSHRCVSCYRCRKSKQVTMTGRDHSIFWNFTQLGRRERKNALAFKADRKNVGSQLICCCVKISLSTIFQRWKAELWMEVSIVIQGVIQYQYKISNATYLHSYTAFLWSNML